MGLLVFVVFVLFVIFVVVVVVWGLFCWGLCFVDFVVFVWKRKGFENGERGR